MIQTTVINVSEISKDEQSGKMEFTANGKKFFTDGRGDGLFTEGKYGHKKLCGYNVFSVRGMDAVNSKIALADFIQNSQVVENEL